MYKDTISYTLYKNFNKLYVTMRIMDFLPHLSVVADFCYLTFDLLLQIL